MTLADITLLASAILMLLLAAACVYIGLYISKWVIRRLETQASARYGVTTCRDLDEDLRGVSHAS